MPHIPYVNPPPRLPQCQTPVPAGQGGVLETPFRCGHYEIDHMHYEELDTDPAGDFCRCECTCMAWLAP
jgi:hypothetical protein